MTTRFRISHAVAEEWPVAARACVDALGGGIADATLGFAYVTDLFADEFPLIVEYLRRETGVACWVGGVGMGICAGSEEYFDQPAIAVMVAPLAPESFRLLPALRDRASRLDPGLARWIERASPVFGIVHADPRNPKLLEIVEDIAARSSAFLVGGLTSSRGAGHQLAGAVSEGGLSGILFAPEVEVLTGLSQGCSPVAGRHLISDSLDNILIGLDGRPALEVFTEDVGELLARDLSRVAGYIHAAFPIPGSDTADYLVRNLIGIDPERGWLAVGERVRSGGQVMFVRRDPRTAEADLKAMLHKLRQRAGPRAPRGALYVSCIARGPQMFGRPGREMAMIRDAFADLPVVGFYAGGEISNNRLYGYTGVLTLFL